METEQNGVNASAEEKEEKAVNEPAEEKEQNASETVIQKENATNEIAEEKETLNDSDIIDINSEEKEEKNSGARQKGQKKTKSKRPSSAPNDFIAKQKKRKTRKRIIIIAVIAAIILGIVLWIRNVSKKTKDMLAGMQANNVQTAFVEKKTLYDSKNATGTLYALDSRTISRSLQGSGQGGAQINAVNVKVGDHVSVGDVLVEFSSENIEKSIAEAKEDIGTQKKLDAITQEDEQRKYVYSYESAASSMKDAAQNVERKLQALYEACDAYGDAKRARDEAKSKAEEKGYDWDSMKSQYENAVTQAFQAEQQAQREYDAAVEAQANNGNGSVASVSNSLSEADSSYKKAQISAGENVKKLQRQLDSSIDSLDDYIVYATIDGVVTEVDVSEGNTFVSGNVLTIQDDSGFKADVLVDEYDIPKVKKAYEEKQAKGENLEVVVKTDATGDNEYKGHVTLIAPTSTTTTAQSTGSSGSSNSSGMGASSSSTANYKVSIELDELDDAFMIGMSAKVAIVVNQSPADSLCVPYNCVEQTEDGRYIVKVMDENGDKSTADDMPQGAYADNGNRRGNDRTKGVNGIVIENDAEAPGNDKEKKGLFDKKDKNNDMELGRRYREVEVDKIFDTDYYAAVVPKVEGSLKEGDEIMVVTEKANGNDMMMMFGMGGVG